LEQVVRYVTVCGIIVIHRVIIISLTLVFLRRCVYHLRGNICSIFYFQYESP
jgi:hypothetical protein